MSRPGRTSKAANASNASRFVAGARRRELDKVHPSEQERVRELGSRTMGQMAAVYQRYVLMARFEPGRLASIARSGDATAQRVARGAGIRW